MGERRRAVRWTVAAVALLVVLATACQGHEAPTGSTSGSTTGAVSTSPVVDLHAGVIPIGSMDTARAAHTATTLRDGRVLIAGGFGVDGGDEASAELFHPDTRAFVPTGSMAAGRQSHTATLLRDGRVLIAGGYDPDGHRLASAEVYDPRTGVFALTGSMNGPRADHTATLLGDGRVLIAGGTGPGYSFLSTAEIYDPRTGTFAPTGSMAQPRESHTATLLSDGRVLITGGHEGRHEDITIYASAEVFDPTIGAFSPVGDMTIPRHKHDAVLLRDGSVLIVGGSDERDDLGLYDSAEIYDPGSATFAPIGPLGEPRYKMRGTTLLLGDGRALVCCGASDAELYDPASRAFRAVTGSFGAGPLFAAAALAGPRTVLVTGGYSLSGPASAAAWLVRV